MKYIFRVRIPKGWKNIPFTSEDWLTISRIVYNARERRKYHKSDKSYYINKAKAWKINNKDRDKELRKIREQRLKIEVLSHYGELKCLVCGETNIKKLCLDHKNNDGKEHREIDYKRRGGKVFYLGLKRQGFPQYPPLQILCLTCNLRKN